MSFLERAPRAPRTLARVLFTKQSENGAGFGVCEHDGSSVYISKSIVYTAQPQVGHTYGAHLIPNEHPTALAPWFTAFLNSAPVGHSPYFKTAERHLAGGDVVTGADLAEAEGGSEKVWEAVLDAVYAAGGCSKFVRFDAPSKPHVRAWYTKDPDAADVAVWEDDE